MKCTDHPLWGSTGNGVLMRSWYYAPGGDDRMHWSQSVYLPQYTQHSWVPVGDPTSTKYLNLDYFTTHSSRDPVENYCTINFQRRAKVYLLVHGWVRNDPDATLAGWKSEGWVEFKPNTSSNRDTIFGLGKRKGKMYAPSRAYVFSKIAESLTIPSHHVIGSNIRGINLKGYWSVLISEADGSASVPPKSPPTPPTRRHTKKMFKTYHPLWDPCFWCAYDHEHGSDAKSLMGYAPKYGYTA
eukprot:IDg5281t1